MKTKNFSEFLQQLTSIAPRRGVGEQKAAKVIGDFLNKHKILFQSQQFQTKIPLISKADLKVDGENIPCLGASFVSGKIDNSAKVLNAFGAIADTAMIIFNPVSLGICLQSYKHVPAVAINRDAVVKLVMGTDIFGEVVVEESEFTTQNFLIGNSLDPQRIIFAHYDSLVGSGALDNAAAVDVLFQAIVAHSSLLDTNLFVLAGSEEESLSSAEGCFGFEMFDKKYAKLINSAREILVLDGVGVGEPSFVSDHLDWVFAVSRITSIAQKIFWMQNDQSLVMSYYHTALDTLDILDQKYIDAAEDLLLSRLQAD